MKRGGRFGAILALVALGALAGCTKKAQDDGRTVVVGLLPVADLVALRVGVEKGFFAREGIDVQFVDVPRGDAAVSAVLSDAVNVASVDLVTGLVAQGRGLPIAWITTAHSSPPTSDAPFAATFVRAGDPIRNWADLNGKRIGVSCIKCGTELYIRGAVDANGGRSETLQLIVMPTAQSLQSLGRGDIDAVPVPPGLVRRANTFGYRAIGDHIAETALGHPLGPLAVNTAWADAHPKLIKAFIRGVEASTGFASANHDAVRRELPKYYPQMIPDQAAAAATPLAIWSSCFQLNTIRSVANLSLKYGFIAKPVTDLKRLFYTRGVRPRECGGLPS